MSTGTLPGGGRAMFSTTAGQISPRFGSFEPVLFVRGCPSPGLEGATLAPCCRDSAAAPVGDPVGLRATVPSITAFKRSTTSGDVDEGFDATQSASAVVMS